MDAVSPVTKNKESQSVSQPTARIEAQNIAENYDTFLNLLTVQLQNQDPLNPMDPTQFVSQLAQFSQLEQSVSQTDAMEKLVALGNANESRAGIDFLGRPVEAVSDQVHFDEGTASFAYEVNSVADEMEIRIFDSSSNLIAKIPANATIGRHAMTWDGTKEKGGYAEPGIYRAELVAIDGEETKSGGEIILTDVVEEFRYDEAGPVLYLSSGVAISPNKILSVQSQ